MYKLSKNGQTSHFPALCACTRCLNSTLRYKKVAVVVVTTDCEESNKQALTQLHDDAAKGTPLQNCPFLLLCMMLFTSERAWNVAGPTGFYGSKEQGQHWQFCTTWEERLNLSYEWKLRNCLQKNGCRSDPSADHPEASRWTSICKQGHLYDSSRKFQMRWSNCPGMYPHSLSVTCSPFGKLLVVDFHPLKNTSKLSLVCLHSSADVIVLVEDLQIAK